MNAAKRLRIACFLAFAGCTGAVALAAELTASPVPTASPSPSRTPRPASSPAVTPAGDGCHRPWHGQLINCCVKHAPPPPCVPETCAARGGVCETNPCGPFVCWIPDARTPSPPPPTPSPKPILPPGECSTQDCPRERPLMPNWQCADGQRGGPVCKRHDDGTCGWAIVDCPRVN